MFLCNSSGKSFNCYVLMPFCCKGSGIVLGQSVLMGCMTEKKVICLDIKRIIYKTYKKIEQFIVAVIVWKTHDVL